MILIAVIIMIIIRTMTMIIFTMMIIEPVRDCSHFGAACLRTRALVWCQQKHTQRKRRAVDPRRETRGDGWSARPCMAGAVWFIS